MNRATIWKSQDGRKTQIKDMGDRHLSNALAKIKREENWRREYLCVLTDEYNLREGLKHSPLNKALE